MISIDLFFYIAAAVCFGLAWFNSPWLKLNWLAGGLFWLTLSLIF